MLDKIASRFNVSKMFKNDSFWDMLYDKRKIYGCNSGVDLVIVPDIPGMARTTDIIDRITRAKEP